MPLAACRKPQRHLPCCLLDPNSPSSANLLLPARLPYRARIATAFTPWATAWSLHWLAAPRDLPCLSAMIFLLALCSPCVCPTPRPVVAVNFPTFALSASLLLVVCLQGTKSAEPCSSAGTGRPSVSAGCSCTVSIRRITSACDSL